MAEIFGKNTKGGLEDSGHENWIFVTKFTSGSAGFLASMTLYLKEIVSGAKIKCAIYDSSRNLLTNGTTEEKILPLAYDDWITFNFPTPPEVTELTEYYLAYWFDLNTLTYYVTGEAEQMAYRSLPYGTWPDPLVPDGYMNWVFSIYATYQEAAITKTLAQACLI